MFIVLSILSLIHNAFIYSSILNIFNTLSIIKLSYPERYHKLFSVQSFICLLSTDNHIHIDFSKCVLHSKRNTYVYIRK